MSPAPDHHRRVLAAVSFSSALLIRQLHGERPRYESAVTGKDFSAGIDHRFENEPGQFLPEKVVERPSSDAKGETGVEYIHKIKLVDKTGVELDAFFATEKQPD
jgi:hypothetical protein